ncbi:MAG: Imm15 family immunity protein [Betaproteobacteria bacterium]|nr:Imm15 family immunity protein [Betaproteobacteria bacterium]
MKNSLDKSFERLVKKEDLDNFEVYFRKYTDFEEIPLFSRYAHISFLRSLSFNEKNKFLIKKGLELIDKIIQKSSDYLKPDDIEDYFICLSVSDWDDYEEINCLTPSIFITRRKKWILSHLSFRKKYSIEEYLIEEYLNSLSLQNHTVFVSKEYGGEYKYVYIVRNGIIKQRPKR